MTVAEMRALLGLGADVSDAAVAQAWGEYAAGESDGGDPDPVVTLEDVKSHLNVDHADDDLLIAMHLDAAVAQIEHETGRALTRRGVAQTARGFAQLARLAVQPVRTVTALSIAGAGGPAAVDPLVWRASPDGVVLRSGAAWPGIPCAPDAVTVLYQAGHDAALPVPARLKVAVLMLAAHFYRNREAVLTGVTATALPIGVAALCDGFRAPVIA